ncbi:hypothetical protein CC80DRAFT_590382 [Byssothecium circinans]|uniref:Uncharacterized protein n=1 Tax=Byssothecium circinans TaxID=147558 RepID=A0A6A5U4I2_9PLEO|nr:hypothetical protein CC80DRAFT_590382 [Byssothecium circinans]
MFPPSCSSVLSSDSSVWSHGSCKSTIASSLSSCYEDKKIAFHNASSDSSAASYCIELDDLPAYTPSLNGQGTGKLTLDATTSAKSKCDLEAGCDKGYCERGRRPSIWKRASSWSKSWMGEREINLDGKIDPLSSTSELVNYDGGKVPAARLDAPRPRWPRVPETIVCTFEVGDQSYIRELDYGAFRKWGAFAEFLEALEDAFGTPCMQLWDVREEMDIMAGDWEARVRPGWVIIVVCGEPWSASIEDIETEIESDGEECGESARGFESKMWWFTGWRRKVERKRDDFVRGDRAWIVGAIGMAGVIAAFCIVLYAFEGL